MPRGKANRRSHARKVKSFLRGTGTPSSAKAKRAARGKSTRKKHHAGPKKRKR